MEYRIIEHESVTTEVGAEKSQLQVEVGGQLETHHILYRYK